MVYFFDGEKGLEKWLACYSYSLNAIDLISLNAIDLIIGELNVYHQFGNVVTAIKRMLRQNWSVFIKYTLREGNFSTDFLAKMGFRSGLGLSYINETSPGMSSIILADVMGVPFIRH